MRKLYQYPRLIVAVIAVITVFFGLQLPKAELDNNNFRFVPAGDPANTTSRWIDETFGSSQFILVGLERLYGTVFDREFLDRIREYAGAVQEVPIVKNITSLITADYITASGDSIVVEKLVRDDFSGTPEEIAELKRRLLSWDMYERALFSDDFTATQILIPLTISSGEASSPETNDYFIRIRDMARETFAGYASVYVTGMPVISASVSEAMQDDLKLLVPLVILVVLTVLFFSLRRLTLVALPLLTVLIAVIWSMGAMPLFGVKLSVISTVLPVILVAVGSAYGIHVVTHYLNGRGGREMNRAEHRELVIDVVMKIRKAVLLAAMTTFTGFCSFCFTSVVPIREFGFFAGFGTAAAFIVAITLIPALLIIRGPKPVKAGANAEGGAVSGFVADNLIILAKRKKTILLCAAVVIAVSVYGFSKLVIDNIMVEYFKEDSDVFQSDAFIRRQFGGSKVVSVVVQAESPEILLRPDTLAAMDGLSDFLRRKVPAAGKVMGFTDLVKRINQVFNANESPDGLRAAAENASFDNNNGASAPGFGDFGLSEPNEPANFGFGEFDFEFSDAAENPMGQDSEPDKDNKVYTRDELFALFDAAASRFRGMNANELVWALKRQVNYDGASYYEIPVDPQRYGMESPAELQQLIANYLILLSGSLDGYANDPLEPTAVKATVQLRTRGMYDSRLVFREMEKYIAANFPADVTVTIGGTSMVENSLNDLVVQSQIVSMVFSIICVFIIIAAANKSLIAGCIGIVPLSVSILLNFAVMGFMGIKLNIGTSMVAAVSIGVGIDYTIHCLEAYKREYRLSGGTGDFPRRVFFISGKAIIINAVSVGAGFAVLLLSRFTMLGDLGLLIAMTMLSSALVSLTVLPALLSVIKPKFIAR